MSDTTETIAEYRRRYEALKASGQAPKTLPDASSRPAAVLAEDTIIHHESVAAGWYWTTGLRAGEALRLQTMDGTSSVSLLAWNKTDPSERLNTADTLKVQWTAALRKGRVIFSDMGRVLLSITEDSGAGHDALVGGSTAASNARRYGDGLRNTRDNFLLAVGKVGLDARDIPPCITFFAPVVTDKDGRFVWLDGKRQPGDYVELRAEMDLVIAISNCPHPLDPSPIYGTGPIEVTRYRAPNVLADDLCRTATAEAVRGFENNAMAAV